MRHIGAVIVALSLALGTVGHAQVRLRIHGKVMDSKDSPIPSVLIRLYRGTQKIGEDRTEDDGSYEIQFTGGVPIDKIRYDHSDWHSALVTEMSGNQSSEIHKVLLQVGQRLSDVQKDDVLQTLQGLYRLDRESGVTDTQFRAQYRASVESLEVPSEKLAGLPFAGPAPLNERHLVPVPDRNMLASGHTLFLNDSILAAAKRIAPRLGCRQGSRVAVLDFTDPGGQVSIGDFGGQSSIGSFVADELEAGIRQSAPGCDVVAFTDEPALFTKHGNHEMTRYTWGRFTHADTFITGSVVPTATGHQVVVNWIDSATGKLEGSDTFKLASARVSGSSLEYCTKKGTLIECDLGSIGDAAIRVTEATDDLGNQLQVKEIRKHGFRDRVTLVFSGVSQEAKSLARLVVSFGVRHTIQYYNVPLRPILSN